MMWLGDGEGPVGERVAYLVASVMLLSYRLCRFYLPVAVSALTAALIGLHPSMVGYSTSLKQYTLDAAVCVGVLVAWRLGEQGTRAWSRTVAAVGTAGGLLVSMPMLLLVPPLLGLTAVRAVREWRAGQRHRLLDAVVAGCLVGAVAAVHYLWWLRPQAGVAAEWRRTFPPHAPGTAVRYLITQTWQWVHVFRNDPNIQVAGVHPLPTAAAALLLVAGLVAMALRPGWREVAVVVVGLDLVMVVAAWQHRWPYGYLRTSLFAVPLVYLTAAFGAYAIGGLLPQGPSTRQARHAIYRLCRVRQWVR